MTTKGAYEYFVLKAQEIALSKNWTPVNWYDPYIYGILTKIRVFRTGPTS